MADGPFAVPASLYLIGEHWQLPAERHGRGAVVWADDAGNGYLVGRVLGPATHAISGIIGCCWPALPLV